MKSNWIHVSRGVEAWLQVSFWPCEHARTTQSSLAKVSSVECMYNIWCICIYTLCLYNIKTVRVCRSYIYLYVISYGDRPLLTQDNGLSHEADDVARGACAQQICHQDPCTSPAKQREGRLSDVTVVTMFELSGCVVLLRRLTGCLGDCFSGGCIGRHGAMGSRQCSLFDECRGCQGGHNVAIHSKNKFEKTKP